MKRIINDNYTLGYIEGYYGKLLNWEDRKRIIKSLQKNKMNTYFYAPKEDKNHRLQWRKKYSTEWRVHFRDFVKYSLKNKVNVIAGIAPGLDFNFEDFTNKNSESTFLFDKAKQLLDDGARSIVLLLDDIPNNFEENFGTNKSEGKHHAILANHLSKELGSNIYFVPRVYADELIKDSPNYLKDLSKNLNPDIKVFYCGKNVVSQTLKSYSKINKILSNEIIFWDNYYANDYCPRRLFVGPYTGRQNLKNIMINPTGLINTDLMILDIVGNSTIHKFSKYKWNQILENHGVPQAFNNIKRFFSKPDFGSKPLLISIKYKDNYIDALDFLLWKWKSDLSREWYPYIFGLKQDLQLNQKILTYDRLIKTQTIPLSKYISKNLIKGELL